ncbi:MAG: hypothetical protein HGB01_09980, partial [Chlorobiaceae bacterium]|nr:hypothetical protein [Chlorobiaceae bacterium]
SLGVSVTGTYNGTTTYVNGVGGTAATFTGLQNGETLSNATLTLQDKNVGSNGTNYVTGVASGTGDTASMGNYQISSVHNATVGTTQNMVTLSAAQLGVSVTGTYNGTTTYVNGVGGTAATFTGLQNGETLSSATLTLQDKNVGSNGTNYVTGVASGTGDTASMGNYQISSVRNATAGTTQNEATLSAAPLGVSVSGVYSGSTTIVPTSYTTNGLLGTDTITGLSGAIVHSKDVVSNGSNYVTSLTISGGTASMGNYALNSSYNATAGTTQNEATLSGATVTLIGQKTYDGDATLGAGELTITGVDLGGGNYEILGYTSATAAGSHVSESDRNYVTSVQQNSNGTGDWSNYVLPDLTSRNGNNTVLISARNLTATLGAGTVVAKEYDGTSSVDGVQVNIDTVSGLLAGDDALFGVSGSGAYNSAHVAGANQVTVNGSATLSGIRSTTYNSELTDYAPLTVTMDGSYAGRITPKQLAVNLTGTSELTKVYDGNSSVNGVSVNAGSVTGLLAGDVALFDVSGNGQFDSAHVASATSVTVNGSASLSGIRSATYNSELTDYALPTTSVSGTYTGQITARQLSATLNGSSNLTKEYDGTTSVTGVQVNIDTVNGLLTGDEALFAVTGSGSYNSAHVAGANQVTVNGNASLSGIRSTTYGSELTDYAPLTFTMDGSYAGRITPKQLAVNLTGTSELTKVYDGNSSVNGVSVNAGSVAGLLAGDEVLFDVSGNGQFDSAHVASATSVTVNGSASLSGIRSATYNSELTDYVLPTTSVSGTYAGHITPKALLVNANDAAVLYTGNPYSGGNGVTYEGFVPGETAAVLGGSLTYTGSSQGAVAVGSYQIVPAGLVSTDYDIRFAGGTLDITDFSNIPDPDANQALVDAGAIWNLETRSVWQEAKMPANPRVVYLP